MRRSLGSLLLAAMALGAGAADGYEPFGGRPMLGVGVTLPPIEAQERAGLPVGSGALIQQVFDGTAAQRMGMRPGDVLVSVNGQPIESVQALRNEVVHSSSVGDPVSVTISRDGQRIELQERLGQWPAEIPYTEANDGWWQGRQRAQLERFARQQERLRRVAEDLAELQRQAATTPTPWHESAALRALDDWLGGLPAWRVSLHREAVVAGSGAEAPSEAAAPVLTDVQPWRLRFAMGG